MLTPEVYGARPWSLPQRDCAIVLFLLLLDFLEAKENPTDLDPNVHGRIEQYRRKLPPRHPARNRVPLRNLSISNELDPGEFLALALHETFEKRLFWKFLSDETRQALARIFS